MNWGYNQYTRIYTVLWGASYKYWWDVGQGWHTGLDIATARWTPVYSIADWIVILAKKDLSRWNIVSIKHKIRWKEITSNYAHLSKILVKKWQRVRVWTEIWKVGSTGHSTGNHLHFQIDLKYKYHPFYYSWKTCPYKYHKITESWICFNELTKHTLDPLEFLENRWAILDKLVIHKNIVKENKHKYKNKTKWFNLNIFTKTVHNEVWSSKYDIKIVQKIYKDLGYYKW
jgi:murein DD-endopeptidase MepM/ murein hydrolase activator NlpD